MALSLALALAGCTGSNAPRDADHDGIPDAQESAPHAISIMLAAGPTQRMVTSDPHRADSDDDGLSDLVELQNKTDPSDPDTDRDGLLDGHNVTLGASSALAAAWRARGIVEGPLGTFAGERDACGGLFALDPIAFSSDRPAADKLADGEELRGWNASIRGALRHVVSDPCRPDTDGDGLPDDAEASLRLDPRARDSDGDGAPDAFDADPAWDLGLTLTEIRVSTHASTAVSIELLANETAHVSRPGEDLPVTLNIEDTSPSRASLDVPMIVTVRDAAGHGVDVVGDPRGSTVIAISISFPDAVNGTVSLHGADGSLAFAWSVSRS